MKPQFSQNQGMLIDGNFWQIHPLTGQSWDEHSVDEYITTYEHNQAQTSVEQLQQMGLELIKQQAEEDIKSLDWKVQRARDRIARAELVGESQLQQLEDAETQLLEVLLERESIRTHSNTREATFLALNDVSSQQAYLRRI